MLANSADNIEIIKFAKNIKTKTPNVLKNFLLNKSFKEVKNAINGFFFLKNTVGKNKRQSATSVLLKLNLYFSIESRLYLHHNHFIVL